jgi:hypothetical protein
VLSKKWFGHQHKKRKNVYYKIQSLHYASIPFQS